MDAVREDRKSVSAQYTAEWLNNVERHPKAYSGTQDINKTQAAKVPRSAPALSVKSKQSDASTNRSKQS